MWPALHIIGKRYFKVLYQIDFVNPRRNMHVMYYWLSETDTYASVKHEVVQMTKTKYG